MKIRLDSARFEPFTWQERLTFAAGGSELPEGIEIGPIAVDGTLSRTERDFLLQARLAYRQRVPCDRCLTAVEEGVETGFSLLVVERRGRAEAGERQLGEDELGVLEVAGDALDTAPLVAEQVQLELPARVLCREDCAGLCPRCGRNRNEGPCACPPPAPDPRWRGLGELKTKLTGRGTD